MNISVVLGLVGVSLLAYSHVAPGSLVLLTSFLIAFGPRY